MDLRATKTHAEQQDEEAERLVRPAPKLKPPRRDRRRERVEVDSDPDTEETDPDESRNYKDVGGSVGAVIYRYLEAKKRFTKKPSKGPAQRRPSQPPPPKPEAELVTVKKKDTGQAVQVSEETLKEEGGKYEKIKPEDEAKAKEKPKPDEKEAPAKPKLSPKEQAKLDEAEMVKRVVQEWTGKGGDKEPEFKRFLEAIPTSDKDETTGEIHVLSPAGEKVPFQSLTPEAQKNLIDSYSAGQKEIEEKHKKEETQAKALRTFSKMSPDASKALMELADPKSDISKKVKELAGKYDLKDINPAKVFPHLKRELKDIKSLAEVQELVEAAEEHRKGRDEAKLRSQRNRARKNPDFHKYVEDLPTSEKDAEGNVLVLAPSGKKVPFGQLPTEAQHKVLDGFLAKAQEDKAKQEARQKQQDAIAAVSQMDPDVRDALMTLADPNSKESKKLRELAEKHDLKDIHPDKVLPELKGKLEGVKNLEDAKNMAEAARDYEALSEQEKAGIPDPPRREVSDEEKDHAAVLLATHLPPDIAADLIARDVHPDDVQRLISTYQAGQKQNAGVKDLGSFAAQAAEFYETDPSKVKPPKKWVKDGQEVPFDTLAPEEKAEAMRQYQMDVLAQSMAAKKHLSTALSMPSALTGKPRVPPVISSVLADTMLTKKTPAEAHKMAQTAFETMLAHGEHVPIKDSVARSLFWKLDPQSQIVARGFMQANDYHAAKSKFLGTTKGFSEWDTPQRIIEGLQEADEFFNKRDRIYGVSGHPQHSTAGSTFRNRVLERLQSLKPDKVAPVQKWVQKVENKEYEDQHKGWKKEHDAWEARRRKHEESQGKGGYRDPGRVADFDEPEPAKPVKPSGYTGKLEKAPPAASSQDLLKLMKEARVVQRFLISTYSGCESMGHRSDRSAVYHGIEPEAPGAYPGWGQAHQRDLGEADYTQILASAQKWLKATVISRPAEGMVRDQQLRAALDLALQTSRYDNAINPVVYNMLLARLAGVPEPGFGQTLQTIRGSTCAPRSGEANRQSSNSRETETMTTKLSAEQSKRASEILGRLDTLAKEIQEKHASWGMSFESAKKVVNGLDAVADSFEKSAFGPESFERRQREILAKVVQRDGDEPYMDNFVNPMEPIQTDADEPYMGAYGDDQSSAVQDGKSTVGRPLAP